MESRHVKSINTDKRSTKRIKFASAKERSKGASADVYRSHKRKLGATSSATREEAVHNPHRELGSRKRQRAHHLVVDDDRSKAAVISVGIDDDVDVDAPELAKEDSVLNADSSLADELDETLDRNASEVFGKFYRKVWPMVRSLPEILHHAEKVIDVMLSHMLSPESTPEVPTDPIALRDPSKAPRGYVVNHATLDILHLLSVLARDLRHEIHSYLPSILQRIIQDLLNPPPPPLETGKQPIPLDVTLVETAFRCMSYIFRYDADKIVEDIEAMRKYYGATLAARRELVRRLASQTFAPLIRKLKNQNERHRHLKRVLKALVAATDGQPMTALLKRTQTDAVDGISQLIFQVARGVPGRLHSQGLSTLRFVMTYCARVPSANGDGNTSILLVTLASDLIERLYRHLHENTKASLTEMLAATLKTSCSEAAFSQAGVSSTMNTLRLFSKAATMQFSARGAKQTAEQISLFCETLDILFSKACIAKFSSEQRQEVMTLAAPIWLTLQDSHRAERSLQQCLRIIFGLDDMVNNTHENEAESVRTMTAVLSRDLLPYLKNQGCLGIVGTAALSAAARLAKSDQYSALLTTFAIATKQPAGGESASTTYFRLFHDAGGALYKIPRNVQDVLLETCLVASNGSIWEKGRVEQLLVSLRCIPFVFSLNSEIAGSDERKDLFETTASSLVDVFVNVAKAAIWKDGESNSEDILVVQRLCLESLSRLVNDFLVGSGDEGTVKKILSWLIGSADKLLFSSGSSLWVVRGLAAFAKLLHKVDLQLNDKLDDTFDALVSNLSQPSHELRLHTLEILATYPAKNFVVDHADLDLSGDLDEEPSYRLVDIDRGTRRSPVGKCDLIDILLQIESTKVQLTQERPLLGMVSRVEVLGRTGKLPVIYAEAAAHHLLGLFNVKFAPLWPVVEKALAALAEGHENDIWPALEKKLVATMKAESMQDDEYDDVSKHDMCMSFEEHREACLLWEKSKGRVVTLFGEEPVVQDGEVYRHLTTDKATYMESVWGVAEKS
jgi:U3 small nucleolar RNA-associated protein 20